MPDVAIDSDSATINSVNLTEQGSDPATPASSHWRLYTKSGGLYLIDDTGAVTGPIGGGGDLVNPMTDVGDIIVGGTDGAPERLGAGLDGTYLSLSGGTPAWIEPAFGTAHVYAVPSSTPPNAPSQGDLWFETDTGNVYYREVASWLLVATHTPSAVPPAANTWTWVNQGTATLVDSSGTVLLTTPNTSSYNLRLAMKALPTVPYSVTACIEAISTPGTITNGVVGLFWRQDAAGASQGYLHAACLVYANGQTYFNAFSHKFTAPASTPTAYFSAGIPGLTVRRSWWRLSQDVTNRTIQISTNGVDWVQLDQQLAGDFLTPDQIGFGASGGLQVCKLRLLSWEVVES